MISISQIEPIYFILPIAGFIVGLFGTMLGGGGGFFFLPLLTLLYNTPMQTAIITSLTATLPICLMGSIAHYRKGNINTRIAVIFIITGIIGALAGAALTNIVSSQLLKTGFGIYLIAMAINMALINKKQSDKRHGSSTSVKRSFLGFCAGFITGSLGTSGTAPVLAGLFSTSIPLKSVIGTSLLIVLLNALIAIGAHLHFSSVDITLLGFLTSGSALGALLGPRLLVKSGIDKNEKSSKLIYALVIAGIGILMLLKQ